MPRQQSPVGDSIKFLRSNPTRPWCPLHRPDISKQKQSTNARSSVTQHSSRREETVCLLWCSSDCTERCNRAITIHFCMLPTVFGVYNCFNQHKRTTNISVSWFIWGHTSECEEHFANISIRLWKFYLNVLGTFFLSYMTFNGTFLIIIQFEILVMQMLTFPFYHFPSIPKNVFHFIFHLIIFKFRNVTFECSLNFLKQVAFKKHQLNVQLQCSINVLRTFLMIR